MTGNDEQWILQTLYDAGQPDHETYRVFLTLRRYIYDNRNFHGVIEQLSPQVMRFKPLTDLADDCLFSVSMFKQHIRYKKQKTGAPGVRFYTHVGKHAFSQIGYQEIADQWDMWIHYIQEHFCIQ